MKLNNIFKKPKWKTVLKQWGHRKKKKEKRKATAGNPNVRIGTTKEMETTLLESYLTFTFFNDTFSIHKFS